MGRKKINLVAKFLELGVKVSIATLRAALVQALWAPRHRRRARRRLLPGVGLLPRLACPGTHAPAAGADAACPRCPGAQVVISDVDVLWLRNPLPFFGRFPGADVLTSTDHLAPTVGKEEELEVYPHAGSAFNIGIMLFRERSLPFVRRWIEVRRAWRGRVAAGRGGGGKGAR